MVTTLQPTLGDLPTLKNTEWERGDDIVIEQVRKILRYKGRDDLANLLGSATTHLNESNRYGSLLYSVLTTLEITVPYTEYERLNSISNEDRALLLEIVQEVYPPREHGLEICEIRFYVDAHLLPNDDEELIETLRKQKNIMVSVATGGPRIDSVNTEYKESKRFIDQSLAQRGIENPNPYDDLWEWYGKWSSGDLPSYQSRRDYIRGLFAPLLKHIRESRDNGFPGNVFVEPTGWTRLDRNLTEIRRQLELAREEEQFQVVGLLCRECLITLAQTVYCPDKHGLIDDVEPSNTDAKRMLEAYIQIELGTSDDKIVRKHVRASLDLSNRLQHKRTADFCDAALCAEATSSVINMVAIISGIRNPK